MNSEEIKVIFLDIDGVMNSLSETYYHRMRKDNTPIGKIKEFIYNAIFTSKNPFRKFLRSRWLLDFGFYHFTSHHRFCPLASAALQHILNQDERVRIVISSTWRGGRSPKWLGKLLKYNKIDGSRVIDKTPDGKGMDVIGTEGNGKRGCQIEQWLTENYNLNVSRFVIIDDDADMEHLLPDLVQTSFYTCGLANWHKVEQVIRRLKTKEDYIKIMKDEFQTTLDDVVKYGKYVNSPFDVYFNDDPEYKYPFQIRMCISDAEEVYGKEFSSMLEGMVQSFLREHAPKKETK